jgi:hypothetical protein
MKKLCVGLVAASLIALVGCNTSPSAGGGKDAVGTFKLKGPSNTPATEVKHDSEKTVLVEVDASKEFKEDIHFTAAVEPADKGVTATVTPEKLKAADPKKVEVKIKATDKAAPGDYTVTVTGKPTKGDSTTVGIKVKVPEKK